MTDAQPAVRAKAMRSLGKMAAAGLLNRPQRRIVEAAARAALGEGESYTWDHAYIVRREAREIRRGHLNAMDGNQLREQVQHFIDVPVQEAFDTLLKEQAATNRRVALELQPLFRLRIEFPGQRQLPQVEVGAEETEQRAGGVGDALHGSQ